MAYRAWVATAVVFTVIGVALPAGPLTHAAVVTCGLLAGAVMFTGSSRNSAWLLLAGGVTFQAIGDTVYYEFNGAFPSPADAFYVIGSVLKITGLVFLVRGRRSDRDREGLIDATVFTVSLSLLIWVFVIKRMLGDHGSPLLDQGLALAYPLLDTLLLGLLIRLLTSRGARTPALALLASAVGTLLFADYLYSLLTLSNHDHPVLIDDLYIVAYGLWAAAARHPSRARTQTAPPPGRLTKPRLIALTAAGLVAPGVLAVQLALGQKPDGWAVVICSVILFALVVARMALLLSQVEAQAEALEDLARTDGLTGLPNRRSADLELDRRSAHAARTGDPLVVALVDLDRFKDFNDTYGHQAGDRLLSGCAVAWRAVLKDAPAVVSRYGGEEFLLISVAEPAERVTERLAEMRAATPMKQSFSAGVATWDGAEPLADLLQRADIALYAAKDAGRAQTLTSAPAAG